MERVLIRGPNWMGDQILASDFYRGLREALPKAHLTLALPEEISAVAGPWFDNVLSLSRGQRKSGWLFWGRRVRSMDFDTAITLPASARSAFFLRLSGIPSRLGFAEPTAKPFLTRSLEWKGRKSGKHKAQLYRDLLELVTGKAAIASAPVPAQSQPGTIVLAPGASIQLREWPGFVELAVRLRQKYPEDRIVVVGAAAQKPWSERFLRVQDSSIEDRIGKTSLEDLIALCRACRFVVANDSGVAHLAAQVAAAKAVVLFGPGDPAYVRPLGSHVAAVRAADVACSPCEKAQCAAPFGYQKCLREISVDEVLRHITTLN